MRQGRGVDLGYIYSGDGRPVAIAWTTLKVLSVVFFYTNMLDQNYIILCFHYQFLRKPKIMMF